MTNIKSIDVTYNDKLLHVLYIKEEGKVKIITINKAPKFQYHELLEDIQELVEQELERETKEYKDEQACEEDGGWTSELCIDERDPDWEV